MKKLRTILSAKQREIDRLRSAGGDETGVALMSVMLFMILLSGMSLILLAVIVGQMGPSYAAEKGTKTVYAAQAGLQSALGVLRSAAAPATPGGVFGDKAQLPCSLSGNLDGSTTAVGYTVSIQYFVVDPTGRDTTWLGLNDLACTSGMLSSGAQQPLFAYALSKGTGTAALGRDANESNRSVSAVYKFRIENTNVPGGRIYVGTECLQAQPRSTGSIGVGSLIRFVTSCTTNASQLWTYDSTHQIKLASTTVPGATPLCVTGPAAAGEATQNATLAACAATTAPDNTRWNQLWSWTGDYTWKGQKNPISGGESGYYLARGGDATAGFYLKVATAASGTFSPSSSVGAGAASKMTNQIVNYKEFGRCLDVTDKDIGKAFMIAFPCKQDPASTTGAAVEWNHKWFYNEPATGLNTTTTQIWVIDTTLPSRPQYCLQSPTTGNLVTFGNCTSNLDSKKWTRTTATSNYAGSYLIVDNDGRCLAVDPTNLFRGWSKIIVAACDGTTSQKWNAPATANDSTFGSYKETD